MLNVFPSTGIDLAPLAREAAMLDARDFGERFGAAFFVCTIAGASTRRAMPIRARVTGAPLVTIGRKDTSDLCVRSAAVSQQHAFIRQERGRYFIVDAGSASGTTVNGKPVPRRGYGPPVELTAGAVVRLGNDVELVFLDAVAVHAFVTASDRSHVA
jgi:hypothetical protein